MYSYVRDVRVVLYSYMVLACTLLPLFVVLSTLQYYVSLYVCTSTVVSTQYVAIYTIPYDRGTHGVGPTYYLGPTMCHWARAPSRRITICCVVLLHAHSRQHA